MCVGGVVLFVGVAAFTAVDKPVTDAAARHDPHHPRRRARRWPASRSRSSARRIRAIFYYRGAGVLYGFVATLAKVVIDRIEQGELRVAHLARACSACSLATALGAYFVQTAYSTGPPDLVIAGLTVVDPLVAVVIGIVVLGEASQAPLWAIGVFVVAGVIAVGACSCSRGTTRRRASEQQADMRDGARAADDA